MTRHWLREWGTHASAVLWNDLSRGRHRHCRRFRALERLEDRTLPSTLLVSNPGDHGSGTLRDAIQQADLNPGSTINFSITGTITLSSALPDLIENVTITGPGASVLTVKRSSAAGTPQFSVFAVDEGVMAAISGLTIAGGSASSLTIAGGNASSGGGVRNAGTLTISDSTLSGNLATYGGGIYNAGTLTVRNSTLSGDSVTYIDTAAIAAAVKAVETATAKTSEVVKAAADATTTKAAVDDLTAKIAVAVKTYASYGGGGGIYNVGTLTIDYSTLSGNSATNGGGINNLGMLTIDHSTLSGNSATIGGGISNADTLTIGYSTLSRNSAAVSGGISNSNAGKLMVRNSILSENSATFGGGGIDNGGTLTIVNSTLSGNSATSGGGIANVGTLTIDHSTLSGGLAIISGGISNAGTLTIGNSTLSANRDNTGGSGGGLFYTTSATVIPQSVPSSFSISLFAGNGAPPAGPVEPPAGPVEPPAGPVALPADIGKTSPAPGALTAAIGALTAAIGALAAAPGASVAQLVPLRESALALAGTLLVLTLETSTDDDTQGSSALETIEAILVGPWPTTTRGRSLLPPAGLARTGGGAIEAGDTTGDVANPVPQGAMPWEHFVIGLDDDFDQVRRDFLEQPLDEAESKREGEGTPSPLDDPIALWSPADFALDRWERGMSADRRSTDQLPDPEGTRPLQVSLSWVALALAAGRAWPRRQRRDPYSPKSADKMSVTFSPTFPRFSR